MKKSSDKEIIEELRGEIRVKQAYIMKLLKEIATLRGE